MNRILAIAALFVSLQIAVAEPVAPGQTLAGQKFEWKKSFQPRSAGTYGQYEVTLEAGKTYEIFTSNVVAGNTSDPYLYLLTTSGQVLKEDNNSAGGLNAKIVYAPASTGTYWIRLRSYQKNKYGYCSLTVQEQAPPPPTVIPELHPGDVLFSQIFEWQSAYANRQDGEYGTYQISMVAGTQYTFETSDPSGGGSDSYLYLLNSALQVVKYDDDSGAGYMAKLTFQPGADGVYYLRLRAYTKGASGTCTLTVSGATLPPGTPLLPDLITWVTNSYLKDAYVQWSGGKKLLRFSNTVANRGSGPLELYGVVNNSTGATDAYQVVYNDNGSQTTYLVGQFVFAGHEDHNHWHFDKFAIYELRDPATDALVAGGNKVSFCLLDYTKYTAENISGSPASGVYTCSNQGISKGWADVYSANLDGQFIDITGLPDGNYVLRSIADPLDKLHEEPNTNNVGQITITITGDTVTVQ